MTSTVNCPSPCSTTVRQTPLTAIDAPWVGVGRHERAGHGEPGRVGAGFELDDVAELLDDSGEHQRVSFRAAVIRTSSPISVMSVGRQAQRVVDGGDAEVAHRRATAAQQDRGDVGDDLVDEVGRHEGRGDGRSALEPDVVDLGLGQRRQDLLGVAGPQVPAWAPRRRGPAPPAGRSRSPITTRIGCSG